MQVLLFSIFAGVCGTGLGGIISTVFGCNSDKTIGSFLSFAGGVMTSIVCFELIPEAIDLSNFNVSIFGLLIGAIIILILNKIIDNIGNVNDLPVNQDHSELSKKTLFLTGITMAVAIGLHNIPEGIVIGAGGAYSMKMGAMLTIMIALHDIPEGMAIAAPLIASGMRRLKVLLLTIVSGIPTFIGAVIGMSLGKVSDSAIAWALSIAAGAMMYVVFCEIIPQSAQLHNSKTSSISALVGLLVGLMLTYI